MLIIATHALEPVFKKKIFSGIFANFLVKVLKEIRENSYKIFPQAHALTVNGPDMQLNRRTTQMFY